MKKYIITLFFCLFFVNCMSQKSWYEDPAPHSPNISSLGKFGDIPIGNYTGTPQITIPIYTVKSGQIQVPIALKYHASGVRVNELASWVGLGWALDAGGYVSRTVRSAPDEGPRDGGINGAFNGYYQNYGPNMVLEGAPLSHLDPALKGILNGSHDVEPDLFVFGFGSYSGSFFFDQNRQPHLLPDQDLRVEVVYTEGNPGKFNQFIITTPDGNRYYFGGAGSNGVEAIESTFPNYSANNVNKGFISNWYLTKIETVDKSDIISFQYLSESYKFYSIPQLHQIVKAGDCSGSANIYQTFSEDWIDGARLSKIVAANITVDFIVDLENPRKDVHYGNTYILKTISINANSNSDFHRSFELTTHWEDCPGIQLQPGTGTTLNEDKWRLFLDQVQERDASDETIQPYKFSYYQLPSSIIASDIPKLTRRLSYDQDHWGYFNNAGNTVQNWLLPAISFPSYVVSTLTSSISHPSYICTDINGFGGANREPKWPAMRAGTIKSIQYPTGGSTAFEFESHNYYTHWTEPLIAKTFPISAGNGASTGTNSSSAEYTFPSPEPGETLSVELWAQVTIPSTSSNCAEVHLYDDNNGGAEIMGSSFNCSNASYPSKNMPITLVSGQTYRLRLVATNCMAQVIVTSYKTISKEGYKNVGGLRIHQLTDLPNDNGPSIIKQYQYSNAALFSMPVYFREIIGGTDPYTECLSCVQDGGKKLYDISSSSVSPILTSQGNHIGYGNVSVIQAGYGKCMYTFENNLPSAYLDLQFLKYPSPPPPHILGNGNVKHETYYDESDDIIKEVDYAYETHYEYEIIVPASNVVNIAVPPTCRRSAPNNPGSFTNGYNSAQWINYQLYNGFSRLKKQIVTDHFSNGEITTTFSYEYSPNYRSQISSETMIKSDNRIIRKFTKYPKDYLPSYTYSPTCYDNMETSKHNCLQEYYAAVNQCCIEETERVNALTCLEVRNEVGCSPGADCDECRSDLIKNVCYDCGFNNLYENCTNNLENENNACIETYNAAYLYLINSDKINSDATIKKFYRLWELNKVLPIEETSWLKNAIDARDSVLIAANYFEYESFTNSYTSLEDIRLKSVFEVAPVHPLSDFAISGRNNWNFSKDPRYELKSTSLYAHGRLNELWKEEDTHISYIWSFNNCYPIAKIVGMDYTWVVEKLGGSVLVQDFSNKAKPTKDEIKAFLAPIYGPQNGYDDVMVTTYTYSPLFDMTSETDPNGVTTYYEYDGFGRLKFVKDDDKNILKSHDYHYKE